MARTLGALKQRKSRQMSIGERAWLGAFIEADGSALVRHDGYLVLCISQFEIDPIATALRITQAGTVSYSTTQNLLWDWRIQAQRDAYDIAWQCAPYSWKIQRALVKYRGTRNPEQLGILTI